MIAPAYVEDTFEGARSRTIFWRSWSPGESSRALVVLAHGYGEHSGRYDHVARRLVDEGLSVLALDHHGHGHSTGARARISFADAVADLDRLIVQAGAEHGDVPVFLLGHSMGGAIALRYAMAHGNRLHGLIVSGPLAEVEGRRVVKALGRALGALAPSLPLARLDPALVSRDPSVVAAYRSDPLVHHHPVPAGTVAEFLRHADTLPGDLARVTVATLVLHGTADRLAAPSGSVMVSERLGAREVTVRAYEGAYHEILNEPERDRVLDDIVNWLEDRLAAAPAGERPQRAAEGQMRSRSSRDPV